MSLSFRPVREVWGEHTSNFVPSDTVVNILHEIACDFGRSPAGMNFSETPYGEVTTVWIYEGGSFLYRLENMRSREREQHALALAEKYDAEVADVEALLDNMHGLAKDWRKMLDTDGSIRFYVD